MTRTSTELPRLEPESSASTNSAMAAKKIPNGTEDDYKATAHFGKLNNE